MKRGLVFSLSALTLAMIASAVHAQSVVDISLNLRYNDPADPSEGGTWKLVAKTANANGIAGVSAFLSNINAGGATLGSTAGQGYPAVTAASIGAITPFVGTFGTVTNIVYGQDTAVGADHDANAGTPNIVVTDVGNGAGTPGNVAVDPLRNANWNNVAVLASGTFSGPNRPAFVPSGANSTDANVLATGSQTPPSNMAVDANVTTTVRGDSLASLGLNTPANAGLLAGDANRDGSVNVNDFNLLAANFGDPGVFGWDQGDFNDSGNVNVNDFNLLAANFADPSPPAPAVGAVPEPAAVSLLGLGLLGVATLRRRMA